MEKNLTDINIPDSIKAMMLSGDRELNIMGFYSMIEWMRVNNTLYELGEVLKGAGIIFFDRPLPSEIYDIVSVQVPEINKKVSLGTYIIF